MENMILKHSTIFKYSLIVREILGEYYEDLKAFFKKWIQDNEHEYKVFMSRRCFVLYQLFQIILMEEGEDIDSNSRIIITDKGIVHHEDGLREAKRILLVDDVLVYGRTLNSMYDKLKKLSPQAQIDISVYIKNSGDLCVEEEVFNNIWFRFEEETNVWREFSDRIVYCIYAANMPYTAFVNSYYKKAEQGEADAIEDRFSALKGYAVTNRFQQKYGLSARVYFPENMERYPLLQAVCRKCCVRVYYSSKCNKLLMIPYVFLKDIRMEFLDKLYNRFAELLPEFRDDFLIKSDISIKDEAAYKARLLTCVFSFMYGILLMNELGVNIGEWLDDRDTVQKSFHDGVAEKLFGLSVERIKKVISECVVPEAFCEDAIQTWHEKEGIDKFELEASLKQSLHAYFRDVALLLDMLQGEVLLRGAGDQIYSEIHNIIGNYCKEFSVPKEFENYILESESDLEKFAVAGIYNGMIDDIPQEHADRWVAFYCEQF